MWGRPLTQNQRKKAVSPANSERWVNLKNIETVQGDVSRLARWTDIVRNIIEEL